MRQYDNFSFLLVQSTPYLATCSNMFPRRRKNLFHHLGVGVEPVLGSGPPPKDILVIQGRTKAAVETLVEGRGSGNKKNLQKFLGVPAVPAARSCSTRKDLCSFLGVERGQLERAVSTVSSSGRHTAASSSHHWGHGRVNTPTAGGAGLVTRKRFLIAPSAESKPRFTRPAR